MPPHPVDIYVGRRLRSRRTMLGMSQENLGEAVGVTFQQIQKYERGLNRIGSSRLYEFSRILNVPVSYFFDEMFDEANSPAIPQKQAYMADREGGFEYEKLGNKEVLTLVRSYYEIEDPLVRKRILSLVKSLGPSAAPGSANEDEEVPTAENVG